MSVKRWEDIAVVWSGPDYFAQAIRYAPCVQTGFVDGRIITCPEVVDWNGDGGRDLLLSTWDPNYDGRVFLRREVDRRADGTPLLGAAEVVEGVRGYVTAVKDGERFHLVSASRMRPCLFVYPNVGTRRVPKFGDPVQVELDAQWVRGNEVYHLARFVDIDGDGELELVVGTDYWNDYWPNGIEWNDAGYRAYDAAGRWLGGPLRGFLYAFKNKGSLTDPVLERGRPINAGGVPAQSYGQFAAAFGDLRGTGAQDLIAGEFTNILQFAPRLADGSFGELSLAQGPADRHLQLEHCIHIPCVVDWDGDGHADVLVGAEDGFISFLKNTGQLRDGIPVFEAPVRIETSHPTLHASVLPVPAAHDWTGNGLPDLIVGNATGELLFYPNLGPAERPCLGRETHLTADGTRIRVAAGPTGSIQGPSEARFGYTCPTICDWDGDGKPDLLVSSVLGDHTLYKSSGMIAGVPQFHGGRPLTFRGKPLKTVWRVRPAVVDWAGDGNLSYVVLDEAGVLASYARASDTELTDKRLLKWETGEPITFTRDVGGGRGRMKLCACDWTGDGRIHFLVGTHARACVPPGPGGQPRYTTRQSAILLLENVGTNSTPVFARPKPLKYQGEVIGMGMHACSPEATDWTGTGVLDLIVGIEDGSIVWLKRSDLSW